VPAKILFLIYFFAHRDVGTNFDLQVEQLKGTHVGDKASDAHGGELNVDHVFVQWLNAKAVRRDFAVGVQEGKTVPVA
jgi:hypothetical protein